MIATPISAPIVIMPHGRWPPNMPFATEAMSVACGAILRGPPLAALFTYHTVLYRSRKCCRKISASVFMRNVSRNSIMPPRKSVR